MNICLIGDGLVSIALAKALINNDFKVFMYFERVHKIQSLNRTIGISSSNMKFFQKEIVKIKRNLIWDIKDIEIYDEKVEKNKILTFNNSNQTLFSIIKNNDLYKLLNDNLIKNKNFKKFKINKKSFYTKILKDKKFDLIINCDGNNEIYKKIFYQKVLKNYNSTAYASIINHEKVDNNKAVQIFTKLGPIAFLPISQKQTSIVYSIKNKNFKNSILSQAKFEELVFLNNKKYKIDTIKNFETFFLKSKHLKKYYDKKILAFGDILHQIHPLSGQGFNMSLRDIRVLLDIIRHRRSLGLTIDNSIFKEFENKTKHLNYIFSSGNDFIYEFFNHNNFYLKNFSNMVFQHLNNSRLFNKFATKYADRGLVF